MITIDSIITEIINREGGSVNHPADRGDRTDKGISERAHPEVWADGKVTDEEARSIYLQEYVHRPGFDKISDPHLMAQLVDFGVNSGPQLAVMKLQHILHVTIDGIIGVKTLQAIEAWQDTESSKVKLNNLLMIERVKMIGRIVVRDKSQIAFLSGWLNRALEFFR